MRRSSRLRTFPNNSARRLRKRPLGRYRYVRLRWRVLFTLVDFVGYSIRRFASRIRRLACLPAAEPETPEDPRVILLVQLDHFGDAILTSAILPALRARHPAARIEVLAGPGNREVFEAMPQVDRVRVARANRFARGTMARYAWIASTFYWGLRLRRHKIDLGIDVRGEFPIALILWLCGARRRVGFSSGGGGFLLTDSPAYVPNRPEVESRWALMAELGIPRPDNIDARRPRFEGSGFRVQGSGFRATPGDFLYNTATGGRVIHKAATGGRADPLSHYRPRVALHIGAGTRAKQWPTEHWRELLGRIIMAHGAEVVLVGGGKDRIIAREILGERPWPGVADWTGRLSVVELASVLRRADVVVGADSGPAHLAAAVDTPVVVLFSGTNNLRQWRPCGKAVTALRHEVDCSPCHRERCPRRGHPCMSRLRAEQVAAEVDRILEPITGSTQASFAVTAPLPSRTDSAQADATSRVTTNVRP